MKMNKFGSITALDSGELFLTKFNIEGDGVMLPEEAILTLCIERLQKELHQFRESIETIKNPSTDYQVEKFGINVSSLWKYPGKSKIKNNHIQKPVKPRKLASILLNTIRDTLKDAHIEDGSKNSFDRVCEMLRKEISRKIITHEIDHHTESE